MDNNIRDIIEKGKNGIDCSEKESSIVKQWVKNTTILTGSGDQKILEDIQYYFPSEYGEAIEEIEK